MSPIIVRHPQKLVIMQYMVLDTILELLHLVRGYCIVSLHLASGHKEQMKEGKMSDKIDREIYREFIRGNEMRWETKHR